MSDILTLAEALNAHAAATVQLAQAIANQGLPAPSSPRSEVQAADPQPEKRRGRPPKNADAPSASAEPDAVSDQGSGSVEPAQSQSAPSEPEVTYDAVKALILTVSQAKGRAAAAQVLTDLGVEKGPDLKPEQYAEAVEKLQAVLDEADLA